jgi:hypothetical protein
MTAIAHHPHRVATAVADARTSLAAVTDVPVWSMDTHETGATKTAHWLAHHTNTTRPAAFQAIRLAHGLDSHDLTRHALAEGKVHAEQALVILRALADLPDDLDADLVEKAEATCSAKPAITMPRLSSALAAGSSRSSIPTPPTPTKPSSSNARSATQQRPHGW